MERIFTPWRLEYIRDASTANKRCIFCLDGNARSYSDKLLLFASPSTLVMCNRYPYTSGHLLIAPRIHVSDFSVLPGEEVKEIFILIQECIKIISRAYSPEGFNVGMNMGKAAGAGIEDHIHFHVLPRWEGDTNFMTPLCETRVLPETVFQTFERLLPDFQALKIA